MSDYQFMCALLCIIENGCKWRALPKKYGKWHTIYMKFSRWSENGTIQRIFEEMQAQRIIYTETNVLCLACQDKVDFLGIYAELTVHEYSCTVNLNITILSYRDLVQMQ